MAYAVNQNTLPGIEDTIRAKLSEINARNGTNYFVAGPQGLAQLPYTLEDSDSAAANGDASSQTLEAPGLNQEQQRQSEPGLVDLGKDGGRQECEPEDYECCFGKCHDELLKAQSKCRSEWWKGPGEFSRCMDKAKLDQTACTGKCSSGNAGRQFGA